MAAASIFRTACAPSFRIALAFLGCLASGGSSQAGAPDGVGSRAQQPNAEVNNLQPSEAERAGRLTAGSRRFDLECTTVTRDVSESRGGPGEEPHARPYNVNDRYFVDLDAGKYCQSIWCETSGVWRIHGVNADTVAFFDVQLPDFVRVQTVDLRTGRYSDRVEADGLEWSGDGICRRLPFSGFPDTSNAILGDPWTGARRPVARPRPYNFKQEHLAQPGSK